MPLPLIPIITALAAGGSLVPHAAGGMIVTSAAGYVTGTFLSTAVISTIITTASTTLGLGALYFTGLATGIIGSAGIFGTTIGASGITGALMSVGIISSTPVWVPIAVGGAALGAGYKSFQFVQFRQKLKLISNGDEAQFTDNEAKIVENLILKLGKIGQ